MLKRLYMATFRFGDRLTMLLPAPIGHAASASDERQELLVRMQSSFGHFHDSNDAQKDILEHMVRTSREQKDHIANLETDLEGRREESEQKEPMDRDVQVRDQGRKSLKEARAAEVAKKERRKSRPVSIDILIPLLNFS